MTQVDHPASLQVMVDGVQKGFVTKARIPSHGIDLKIRVVFRQLLEQSAGRPGFPVIGRQNLIKQSETETAMLIGQLEGQTAVTEKTFPILVIILIVARVPDKTSLGIPGSGSFAY